MSDFVLKERTPSEQITYLQGALFEAHARIRQLEQELFKTKESKPVFRSWTPSVGTRFYDLYMNAIPQLEWCDICNGWHAKFKKSGLDAFCAQRLGVPWKEDNANPPRE